MTRLCAINGCSNKKAIKLMVRNVFSQESGFLYGKPVFPKKYSHQAMNSLAKEQRALQRDYHEQMFKI